MPLATISIEPGNLHLGDRTLQFGPAAGAALWRLVDLPVSWAQSREAAGDIAVRYGPPCPVCGGIRRTSRPGTVWFET